MNSPELPTASEERQIAEMIEVTIDADFERKYEALDPGIKDWTTAAPGDEE